jgi:hypothetical protein
MKLQTARRGTPDQDSCTAPDVGPVEGADARTPLCWQRMACKARSHEEPLWLGRGPRKVLPRTKFCPEADSHRVRPDRTGRSSSSSHLEVGRKGPTDPESLRPGTGANGQLRIEPFRTRTASSEILVVHELSHSALGCALHRLNLHQDEQSARSVPRTGLLARFDLNWTTSQCAHQAAICSCSTWIVGKREVILN